MIKYAIYAKSNPCGSIAGYYLTDHRYSNGWTRGKFLTNNMGMSINDASELFHGDGHYNGRHNCGCQFEIVELKDGIPNHLA